MTGENTKHSEHENMQTFDVRDEFIQAIERWLNSDKFWLCPGMVACAAVLIKYFVAAG